MSRTVIVSAVRTPFGKLGGGLKNHSATELGAIAIRAGLERIDLEGAAVEYVIMGQVLQGGAGQAPARQAAVGAGLPIKVPADTVNKVCASSIRAVRSPTDDPRRRRRVVVTGGMGRCRTPVRAASALATKQRDAIDLMIWDGLRST